MVWFPVILDTWKQGTEIQNRLYVCRAVIYTGIFFLSNNIFIMELGL